MNIRKTTTERPSNKEDHTDKTMLFGQAATGPTSPINALENTIDNLNHKIAKQQEEISMLESELLRAYRRIVHLSDPF